MAKQVINVGTVADDETGDTFRASFIKCNENFTELYTLDAASETHAATDKATPVDADEFPLVDSAASWVLKKLTWANLKAAIQALFGLATQPAINNYYKVAVWGDSLADICAPWMSCSLTHHSVFYGGVSGQTSTAIKNRMVADTEKASYITVIWAGKNDFSDPITVKANIATMVAAVQGGRYVVLSITNSSTEPLGSANHTAITQLNTDLAALYPGHYLDVRAAWIAAYNPSLPQDVIDYGNDIPPTSLRADTVHPNTEGAIIIAASVAAYINALSTEANTQLFAYQDVNKLTDYFPPVNVLSVNDGGEIRYGGQWLLRGDANLGNYFFVQSGNTTATGTFNYGIGKNCLLNNTSGSHNIGIGLQALYNNTTGDRNIALGYSALYDNTSGYNNFALGRGALSKNTTGLNNTAIGDSAAELVNSGSFNVAIGYKALSSATTSNGAVAIGSGALQRSVNVYNITAIGNGALSAAFAGNGVTAIGSECLASATSAYGVTAIGDSALLNNTTGDYSTAIGQNAGRSITTASGCVFIGYETGKNETTSNKLYIENSDSSSPLIYGEFNTDMVRINGMLYARKTTEQLRLEYDASNYASFTVDASGNLTLTTTGTTPSVYIGTLRSGVKITPVTTTASPASTDSGVVYTNEGDADGATITLPTAAAGLQFIAYVQTAQTLTITAGTGDTIRIASNVTAAAGSITSAVVGSSVTLTAINATEWVALSSVGSWSV